MNYLGMHAGTGRQIDDLEHIRQSLADVLTTPVGTRVMRREYGSRIPELIDQPTNDATILRLMAETATVVARWEPRLATPTRVRVYVGSQGEVTADIEAERRDGLYATATDLAPAQMSIPLRGGAA